MPTLERDAAGGLGSVFGHHDGHHTVDVVRPASPNAGVVQAGEIVESVNGVDVGEMSHSDFIAFVKAKLQSNDSLTISPPQAATLATRAAWAFAPRSTRRT